MRDWIRRRRWLGGLIAAVLLFGQTAAVAYACRLLPSQPASVEVVDANGVEQPCAGHAAGTAAAVLEAQPAAPGAPAAAAEHPLLCKAHCQAESQSVNSGFGAADVPAAPTLGAWLWQRPDEPLAAASIVAAGSGRVGGVGPPAGTPPLYISLQVLRN